MIRAIWAFARGNPVFVAAMAGALILLAVVRGTERRVDAKWQGAQATATVVAHGRKAVIEAAAGQASARVGGQVDEELADLRRRYDDLRRRMRRNQGGASRADLPRAARAAGQPDAAACRDLDVLTAANHDLAARLVDASEEGDRYRAQLMGWQAWWPQVEAAWALGEKVEARPPEG